MWKKFKALFVKEVVKEVVKEAQPVTTNLSLLSMLQEEGRLVDFLQEDISSYSDAQVGAAVRQVHRACQKSLEQGVAIRPFFQEAEGSQVRLASDYDRAAVKVVGNVQGKPPYTGVVRHRGWQAKGGAIVSPAEVEVV